MYNIYIYHPNESFGINKIQSAKSGHRTDSSRLSAPERAGVPPLGGRKPTRNARVFTGRGNPRGFFAADWTLGRAALPSRFVWRPKKSRIWRDLVEVRIMYLLSHNFMQHAYIIYHRYHVILCIDKGTCLMPSDRDPHVIDNFRSLSKLYTCIAQSLR